MYVPTKLLQSKGHNKTFCSALDNVCLCELMMWQQHFHQTVLKKKYNKQREYTAFWNWADIQPSIHFMKTMFVYLYEV